MAHGGDHRLLINRGSSVPSYIQLAERLKASIARGEFPPGARLPSEQGLIRESGLSRVTVRNGLAVLERDGWIIRTQGLGTFAGHAIDQELSSVRTIPEVLLARGLTPEIEVLSFGEVVAPADVQRGLGLHRRARVVRIERLYRNEGQPIALLHVYLPRHLERHARVLRDENLPAETTFTILERTLGVQLLEARHVISAGVAGAGDARALGIRPGDPILVLERVTFEAGGRPVEYDRFHYHAERYKFSITVPRHPTGRPAPVRRRSPGLRRVTRARAEGPPAAGRPGRAVAGPIAADTTQFDGTARGRARGRASR